MESIREYMAADQLDKTCTVLMELQRQRETIVKMQNAQRSQITAYVARAIGYNAYEDERERKAKWKVAGEIIKSIQREQATPDGCDEIAQTVADMVRMFDLAYSGLEAKRREIEQVMRDLAKSLPAYDWWVSIKGADAYGLAAIVGEAGNLSNYANPAKLWKRFGDAVIDGVAQGKLPKGTAAEVWIEHGYNKRRHSILWRIANSMWMSGGTDNRYKAAALRYKERQIEVLREKWIAEGKKPKDYGPGHAHNRAQRKMRKDLLRDLWAEWNGMEAEL